MRGLCGFACGCFFFLALACSSWSCAPEHADTRSSPVATPFVVHRIRWRTRMRVAVLLSIGERGRRWVQPDSRDEVLEFSAPAEVSWMLVPHPHDDIVESEGTLRTVLEDLEFSAVPGVSLHSWPELGDEDLERVGRMRQLSSLTISGVRRTLTSQARVTDAGLERLEALRHLRSLTITHLEATTDAGVAHLLGALDELEELSLSDLSVGPLTAYSISKRERLLRLALVGSLSIRSLGGLAWTRAMPKLSALELSYCAEMTSSDVVELSGCAHLHFLSLAGCQLLDANVLSTLADLPHLELLDLQHTHLVDRSGVEALARCSSLGSIRLADTTAARLIEAGVEVETGVRLETRPIAFDAGLVWLE